MSKNSQENYIQKIKSETQHEVLVFIKPFNKYVDVLGKTPIKSELDQRVRTRNEFLTMYLALVST